MMLEILAVLIMQISCVEQLTCLPTNPMEIFTLYHHQYDVPNALILGLFLLIINAGLYMRTRSATILAILGIYSTSIVATTWANETVIQPAYTGIMWIIGLAIASAVLIMVLKVLRE